MEEKQQLRTTSKEDKAALLTRTTELLQAKDTIKAFDIQITNLRDRLNRRRSNTTPIDRATSPIPQEVLNPHSAPPPPPPAPFTDSQQTTAQKDILQQAISVVNLANDPDVIDLFSDVPDAEPTAPPPPATTTVPANTTPVLAFTISTMDQNNNVPTLSIPESTPSAPQPATPQPQAGPSTGSALQTPVHSTDLSGNSAPNNSLNASQSGNAMTLQATSKPVPSTRDEPCHQANHRAHQSSARTLIRRHRRRASTHRGHRTVAAGSALVSDQNVPVNENGKAARPP